MKSDIEIARETPLKPIEEIAAGLGIDREEIEAYGRYIAKVPYGLKAGENRKEGKLILVTAITPTKAGIGKTTVSVGLALGMARRGYKAVLALREPSLGPCFGMKGGAAGGGYAQVLPMDRINLHFTGDFHAITSANNMISALLDNYIYQHREEGFRMKEILWRRVLDVNDRSLRQIMTCLGPAVNGEPHEPGFDITPASEIMAILCLAKDLDDLRRRIDNILLGYTWDDRPLRVRDLGIGGAITVLLKDAINPNLVQTTENTPAFIHGGPFANIAHGCNSLLATRMAQRFGDYAITEAGFASDLGAEKFYDIKCRAGGLKPALTVLVATLQGLKMHGGADASRLSEENPEAVVKGFCNLDRHIELIRSFGQSVVVCFNRFASDIGAEMELVREHCASLGVPFAVNNAFNEGGRGAVELADLVVETIEKHPSADLEYAYPLEASVREKIEAVACRVYGADGVDFSEEALAHIEEAERNGFGGFPVCIAKTQYSFSQDPKAYGSPRGFRIAIRDIVVNAGAEMLVAVAGSIIRMPGLPKSPQALRIDLVDGQITGLS